MKGADLWSCRLIHDAPEIAVRHYKKGIKTGHELAGASRVVPWWRVPIRILRRFGQCR